MGLPLSRFDVRPVTDLDEFTDAFLAIGQYFRAEPDEERMKRFTDRRRGVLRAMMRARLDDVRRRGEPIASLWASEEPIYTRFGYGMASLQGRDRNRARAYGVRAAVRAGELRADHRRRRGGEAATADPRKLGRANAGRVSARCVLVGHRVLSDPSEFRDGAGPKRIVVLERDSARSRTRSTGRPRTGRRPLRRRRCA